MALMEPSPFPNGAPKYLRAQLYEYHFTDVATRRATGQWWTREYLGPYLPSISLPEDQRHPAEAHKSAGLEPKQRLARKASL